MVEASSGMALPWESAQARAYAQRMNRVMDYIDRHLDTDVRLETLAGVALFSEFHFHRVFQAWCGETLGEYVRRRRLEVGALYLDHHREMSVLEVAVAVGFGSGEAFARAFRRHFGVAPSQWRASVPVRWAAQRDQLQTQQDRKIDQMPMSATGEDRGLIHLAGNFHMKVQLETLPAARVAYMRHVGPYGESVARFWAARFLPWRNAQGLETATCYGIGWDDPGITPAARCRYDACVEVRPEFSSTSPISYAQLPGGLYAVGQFSGTLAQLGLAWTYLLREWLAHSGRQLDHRPLLERYGPSASSDAATQTFRLELCLPVRAA
ncbi:GyrI-like domain-containing protein [Curvibacter sp. APW13]|uniref:AraC family transcriptional regulator n=1 Tax=Curvibacter sp. APW13 TaxID=3077236 RepID=UPI0028E0046D|nr:GyrI-like domain-containing protein [Curvibacter sp. APW13]MDT8989979.1 GyrI-like domain-containing protein [Curvibacter sp. APW13]